MQIMTHRGGRVRSSSGLIMERSARERRLGAVAGSVRSPARCSRHRCQWPSHHRSVSVALTGSVPVALASVDSPSCREQHSSWRSRAIRCRSMTLCAAHLARRAAPSLPVPKTIKDLRKGNSLSRRRAVSDRQASSGSDQGRLALGPVTGRAALSRRPCSSASGPCRR